MTPADNPMAGKTIWQVLEEANSHRAKKARIETLHKYSCKNLKTILDYTFNPNIKWLLPEGTPPFEKNLEPDATTVMRLQQDIKRLAYFVNIGPYPNMDRSKREQLFINMLEYLNPKDAELLCSIKDKTLPFGRLSKEIVSEAFPILANNW